MVEEYVWRKRAEKNNTRVCFHKVYIGMNTIKVKFVKSGGHKIEEKKSDAWAQSKPEVT